MYACKAHARTHTVKHTQWHSRTDMNTHNRTHPPSPLFPWRAECPVTSTSVRRDRLESCLHPAIKQDCEHYQHQVGTDHASETTLKPDRRKRGRAGATHSQLALCQSGPVSFFLGKVSSGFVQKGRYNRLTATSYTLLFSHGKHHMGWKVIVFVCYAILFVERFCRVNTRSWEHIRYSAPHSWGSEPVQELCEIDWGGRWLKRCLSPQNP